MAGEMKYQMFLDLLQRLADNVIFTFGRILFIFLGKTLCLL